MLVVVGSGGERGGVLCSLWPLDGIVTLHCLAPPSDDRPPSVRRGGRMVCALGGDLHKLKSVNKVVESLGAHWSEFIDPELQCGFRCGLSLLLMLWFRPRGIDCISKFTQMISGLLECVYS